ncbi:response regulator transcription factor [Salibaculum griseiflavum]|uniref:DNA-binding response regulator n=1 Tax=Salibaculum griseiflavum TaxID=1914409 RepID=A0A2V1NZK3_9RHOB|nr:response regulator transcription factor [Salibaculum griseiflavum]PWG15625.1 hypothetical protein DFK10_15895 [Salibaculum griseiflavum]
MVDPAEILLIDDDHDFCDSVSSFFDARSIPVLTATDPRLLQSMSLDCLRVILLDIDMPRLSGIDALPIIRSKSDLITTIMVSGHSDLTTRLSALEKGADFFLGKPVDLPELFLVVSRILGKQAAEDASISEAHWLLSRNRCALISPTGDAIGLSASEFRVVEALFSHAPEPVSKEELTEAATGRIDVAKTYSRALEVLVSRVRSRVNTSGTKLPIKALRNVGYVFHGNGVVID